MAVCRCLLPAFSPTFGGVRIGLVCRAEVHYGFRSHAFASVFRMVQCGQDHTPSPDHLSYGPADPLLDQLPNRVIIWSNPIQRYWSNCRTVDQSGQDHTKPYQTKTIWTDPFGSLVRIGRTRQTQPEFLLVRVVVVWIDWTWTWSDVDVASNLVRRDVDLRVRSVRIY